MNQWLAKHKDGVAWFPVSAEDVLARWNAAPESDRKRYGDGSRRVGPYYFRRKVGAL